MAWKLHAIEETQLRGRRRVDSVGRPKFDFHIGPSEAGRLDAVALARVRRVRAGVGPT